MSDPELPPPPPPPNLAPPEGYVGYAPTNWQQGLRRTRRLAKALLILLVLVGVGQAITVVTTSSIGDSAADYLAGTIDEDDFRDDLAVNGATSALLGLVTIAVLVLSIIWLYRTAANHRTLGRQLRWAPGWAIAGWVLPPLLFVIPLLMLRETWKAAAPQVPPGSDEWRREGESPFIWLWFLLYSVIPLLLAVLGAAQIWSVGRDIDDLAEYFDEESGLIIAQGVVSVLAVIAWALVVRDITARHTKLTGEDTQR